MAMALFRPAASLRPAEHGQLAEERLACGSLDLALGVEQLLTPPYSRTEAPPQHTTYIFKGQGSASHE